MATLALVAAHALAPPAARADATHAGSSAPRRSALVVLLAPCKPAAWDAVERELQSIPALSVAMLSTTQGAYTTARVLSDLDRAARAADALGAGRRHDLESTHSAGGRLVIVRLASAPSSFARLRALVAARRPGELLLVLEQPSRAGAHELRWAAAAGLDRGGSTLSSQSTEQRGMIAAVDVAPTVTGYLRLATGAVTGGKPIHPDGHLDGGWLRSLKARLEVVYPRRLPALACLLGAWALLLIASAHFGRAAGSEPPGTATAGAGAARWAVRPASWTAGVRWALRVGALAVLWTPIAVLVPAAVEPSAAAEYALIVGTSFALAALTDVLLPWPRAPILPAAATILALGVDALAHTQLLMRSLLGPNPGYGARFYGIGNELKPALAVLVFAAVAAGLYRATRSLRTAAAMAGVGALLAAIEGWALIGAGVGGTILVCAGAAIGTMMLLPHRVVPARRLAAVVGAPALGLAALAALDLGTAHGAGHFTGSVLDASSAGDVAGLIARRYEAAWRELGTGLMPLASALALLLAGAGIRYRERLLAPVALDPGWTAALAGGLTAGVVGALGEDSGPVLLVVAVFTVACLLAYLWGAPLTPRSPDTPPAARSRALTPSTARGR